MPHTVRDKTNLVNRISRIVGQLQAARRGIEAEEDCTAIMQMTAASRAASTASWRSSSRDTFAIT
jgi:DNA-binding FrmR family transcriptional regulator